MIKPQGTKFAITLAAVMIIAVAIAPIHVPGFAQSTSTTNSNTGSSNTVKTLRIGYYPNINHTQAVIGFGNASDERLLCSPSESSALQSATVR